MKKILFILLVPIEIVLLFLLSYFSNGFFNKSLVQAYLLPVLGNVLDPNIASLLLNGIVDAISILIIIVLLGAIFKIPLKGFGFNINNFQFSLKKCCGFQS